LRVAAFPQNNSLPDRLNNKSLVVLWSTLRKNFVSRAARRNALQSLADTLLGLMSTGSSATAARPAFACAKNKFLRRVQTAIEMDRADQCLEGSGQR